MGEEDVDALIGALIHNITSIEGEPGHGNWSDVEEDAFHQRFINAIAFQIVICLSYALIFLVGIMGNILVCYIVYSRKHMQNVTNYFITNLALADILLCILAVPFTPLYTFLGKWVFGSVMCRLVASAQGVSVYISSLTLTSIAIDRFIVILYPFRPRMRVSTCVLMIVLIWIFSVVAMAPYSVFIRIIDGDHGESYCSEEWPSEFIRRMFGIFTVKLQFIVPFVIISICYMKISMALGTRVRNMSKSRTSRKDEMERERMRKTNRMLIAMVAIFGISWLPMNLVNFISDLYKPAESWPYFQMTFSLTHMLAMASTCYNPILYAWLNENFRKEFKEVLPCWRSVEDDTGRVSNRLIGLRSSFYGRGNGTGGNGGEEQGSKKRKLNVSESKIENGNERHAPFDVEVSAAYKNRAGNVTDVSVVTKAVLSGSEAAQLAKQPSCETGLVASLNCRTMEVTFRPTEQLTKNRSATAVADSAATALEIVDETKEEREPLNNDSGLHSGLLVGKTTQSRERAEAGGFNRRDVVLHACVEPPPYNNNKHETRRLLTSDL